MNNCVCLYLKENGLEVHYKPPALTSLRTNFPIFLNGHNKFKFSILIVRGDDKSYIEDGLLRCLSLSTEISNKYNTISVGIVHKNSPHDILPGMDTHTYGYHLNDGAIYFGGKSLANFYSRYDVGDVIGVSANKEKKTIKFKKNGTSVCVLPMYDKILPQDWYACIGFARTKAVIRTSFGGYGEIIDHLLAIF